MPEPMGSYERGPDLSQSRSQGNLLPSDITDVGQCSKTSVTVTYITSRTLNVQT